MNWLILNPVREEWCYTTNYFRFCLQLSAIHPTLLIYFTPALGIHFYEFDFFEELEFFWLLKNCCMSLSFRVVLNFTHDLFSGFHLTLGIYFLNQFCDPMELSSPYNVLKELIRPWIFCNSFFWQNLLLH